MPQDAVCTGLQRVSCRGETVVLLILPTRQMIKETWQIRCGLTGERGTGLSEQNSKSSGPHRDMHLVGNQKSWKFFSSILQTGVCSISVYNVSSPSEFRDSPHIEPFPWTNTLGWDCILYRLAPLDKGSFHPLARLRAHTAQVMASPCQCLSRLK